MSKRDKMLAEWFWCDRWMASSAFLLSIDARGLYREMLTQAWMRGAKLPNDHAAIRRATGCSEREWAKYWPMVAPYWRIDGASLVNDTQLGVYAEALAMREAASNRGKRGAQASAQARTQVATQATAQALAQAQPKPVLEHHPLSLSPVQEQIHPLTPAVAGAVSRKDITRPERKWAENAIRVHGGCPHREADGSDECRSGIFCIGRLVTEKRAEELRGRKAGVA